MIGSLLKYLSFGVIGMILLAGAERSLAQTGATKKYLKIGDTIPDIPLKIFNYPDSIVKPSDFRGKLLLLDFWATWCASCVANFPKMEQIQNKFEEQIQILPIALHQGKSVIEKFYNQRRQRKMELNLPTVVDDSLMASQYYFETIPLVIWVNDNGVVIGITDSGPVNTSIIEKVLNGEDVKLPLKYHDPTFQHNMPYLTYGNGGSDTSFTIRSMFAPYNPNINGKISIVPMQENHRVFFANHSALVMYQEIYEFLFQQLGKDGFGNDYLNKRMIVESENKLLNEKPPQSSDIYQYEEYKHRNWFCYELIAPKTFNETYILQKAITDFDLFFQVKSSIELRKVKCLVLKQLIENNRAITSSNSQSEKAELMNDTLSVQNLPTIKFCYILSRIGKKLPIVIDETENMNNLNIQIAFKKNITKDELNKELAKYDLELMHSECELEMLVITDRK